MAAVMAASASRTPQTLHIVAGGGSARSSRASTAGEGARIRLSPTKTPLAPTSRNAVTSAWSATPESASKITSDSLGTSAAQRPVVLMSTSNV
eukprot:scaffold109699_cov27-Tisochrysis_lutea.AAC.3